ncbi:MAG: hypothetical protein KDC26_12900 [Armatimonadetes bacterium]|nr:hypothetical protein [Armatimonadota bacterium]
MRADRIAVAGLIVSAICGGTWSVQAKSAPQLTTLAPPVTAPEQNIGNTIQAGRFGANKARQAKSETKERVNELNELEKNDSKPIGEGLASKIYGAGEVVSAFHNNASKARKELAGQIVQASGVVLDVKVGGGFTLVVVGPKNGSKSSTLFAFKFAGEKPMEAGSFVTLEGKVAGFEKAAKELNGHDVIMVDGTEGAAQPGQPEVPREALDGWRFVGYVQDAKGGTAVFTKEKDTVYAQKGEEISPGVKVKGFRNGQVVMDDAGDEAVIMPW